MNFIKILSVWLLLVVSSTYSTAQDRPFWQEISRFKQQDSTSAPEKGQILFVGSSTFTFWRDVNDYFPKYRIINRGFGGSALPDLILYANEIIIPYQPRQVVIYCGENDFARDETLPVDTVVNRFKILFSKIRQGLPQANIAFVSMKPSPSRTHLMKKFEASNKDIKKFLAKQKNTAYINIYDAMLEKDGSPKQSLFKEDNLHMNASGYQLWKPIIEPYLRK